MESFRILGSRTVKVMKMTSRSANEGTVPHVEKIKGGVYRAELSGDNHPLHWRIEQFLFVTVDNGSRAGNSGRTEKDFLAHTCGPGFGNSGSSGRGPTILISPFKTFQSWGSSFSLAIAQPATRGSDASIIFCCDMRTIITLGRLNHGAKFK